MRFVAVKMVVFQQQMTATIMEYLPPGAHQSAIHKFPSVSLKYLTYKEYLLQLIGIPRKFFFLS